MRSSRALLPFLACVVLTLTGTMAAAQQAPRSILPSLCENANVRIVAAGDARIEGRCRLEGQDSAVLSRDGIERRVALGAVDTLWVDNSDVGQGAMIGALTGGGALALLGLLFCGGMGCDSGEYPQVIGTGVLLGGGVGALTGALIGKISSGWVRRYP